MSSENLSRLQKSPWEEEDSSLHVNHLNNVNHLNHVNHVCSYGCKKDNNNQLLIATLVLTTIGALSALTILGITITDHIQEDGTWRLLAIRPAAQEDPLDPEVGVRQ